jgi:hypothetical protein
METTGNAIAISALYVAATFALTVWLARTLFHNGSVFLLDVFGDKPELAEAVNRLLVVGFFMFSLGWGLFMFETSRSLDAFAAVQLLIQRLAVLLLVLAAVHFGNVFVFWRIRTKREQRSMPAPVEPQARLTGVYAGGEVADAMPPAPGQE